YTEASLVAALEKRGIGRPSTYASIMSVIEDRGYVERHGQALQPTWLAFAVTQLLEQHFGDLVDYDFTAAMESGLDQIALGKEQREEWLHDFYYGHGDAARAAGHPASDPSENAAGRLAELGLKRLVADQGDIDARKVNTVPLGEGVALRVGRYGPYVEMAAATEGESPRRASVPPELAPDELTPARAKALIEQAQAGGQARELGADPATGHQIVVKDGRYGPYVQEVLPATPGQDTALGKKTKAKAPKPRSASLFKSMKPDTVTLEDALKLLSLPRVVGADPTTGEDITAQNGRFGPYLKRGTDSRSLQSEEQLFTVTLEEALALYAQPKTRRGQARAQAAPLAELGQDPATGKNVVVKDGRWGPYVTDGETNATLPRGEEPAGVTLERAAELLAAKRARGPVKRRSTRKPAAKKPAAKSKSAAKKK
ncbi:MAG: DNA topoisomerase I, partial [Bifidobacteriaceae bacterium]|nr:DNA topoisomerase I [Bifidobacteriaceae bacterium]